VRLLTRVDEPIDATWWAKRIGDAAERRRDITASAWRAVHAEGDGLPSLIVDKYGPYIVAQLLSAGLDTARADGIAAIREVFTPDGVLLRNDAGVRRHEGLGQEVVLAFGQVPEVVEVVEDGLKYFAAPWSGQKTGAFLDQRENRIMIGQHTKPGWSRPRPLCLPRPRSHCISRARRGKSSPSIRAPRRWRGAENARLNGTGNIAWQEANAFDLLRELERRREQFDTIVLDPPAFAKTKANLERAVAGYKEVNLRAMKILAPNGVLFTSSCSYHVSREIFHAMLADAARDSGRRIQSLAATGASADHPELLNVPETGYLKGVLLSAPV
jgi:23S rRNA (cytosine1962-C5)-methyltransferase